MEETKYLQWKDLPGCKLNDALISCLENELKCPFIAKVQKAAVPLLLQHKNIVVQVLN